MPGGVDHGALVDLIGDLRPRDGDRDRRVGDDPVVARIGAFLILTGVLDGRAGIGFVRPRQLRNAELQTAFLQIRDQPLSRFLVELLVIDLADEAHRLRLLIQHPANDVFIGAIRVEAVGDPLGVLLCFLAIGRLVLGRRLTHHGDSARTGDTVHGSLHRGLATRRRGVGRHIGLALQGIAGLADCGAAGAGRDPPAHALHDVRKLVGEEVAPDRVAGQGVAGKEDVFADGERVRVHGHRRLVGHRVGMDANPGEISAERCLHVRAERLGQRLPCPRRAIAAYLRRFGVEVFHQRLFERAGASEIVADARLHAGLTGRGRKVRARRERAAVRCRPFALRDPPSRFDGDQRLPAWRMWSLPTDIPDPERVAVDLGTDAREPPDLWTQTSAPRRRARGELVKPFLRLLLVESTEAVGQVPADPLPELP